MGCKQFPNKPTHGNPVCLFKDNNNPKCLDLVYVFSMYYGWQESLL